MTTFWNQRAADLEKFQSDLGTENTNYDLLSTAHQDLIESLQTEEVTVNSAIDILKRINVRDYLVNRANQDQTV